MPFRLPQCLACGLGKQSAIRAESSGEVSIQFPGRSPFRADDVTGTEVPGAVILTLVSDSGTGTLPSRCYITPPGGGGRRLDGAGQVPLAQVEMSR